MLPPPTLAGAHRRTYQTIFQHPVSHNLQWHDVHAMFRHLGQLDEQPNGNLKVTLHGQTLVLPPPRKKDLSDAEEVIKIRHFLERTVPAVTAATGAETRWLVEINHHEARIFQSTIHGTAPVLVRPREPAYATGDSHGYSGLVRGQEKPASHTFFVSVAEALQEAPGILVFGSGTGTASQMDQFVAWLNFHHPELAQRIAGTLIVDEHHLTDAQLLAKAREFAAPA